jgi:hypothetical protein
MLWTRGVGVGMGEGVVEGEEGVEGGVGVGEGEMVLGHPRNTAVISKQF